MFVVTLRQLETAKAFGELHNQCSHLRKVLGKIKGSRSAFHPFGRGYGPDTPITIQRIAEVCSAEVALKALRADGSWQPRQRHLVTMQYVIDASAHVLDGFEEMYPDDERPREAIDAATACLDFYRSPDAWLDRHDSLEIMLTAHAGHAALDAADAISGSDMNETVARCAAWAAGQAACVGYDYAFPLKCDKDREEFPGRLEGSFSESEGAEWQKWADGHAEQAAWHSHIAGICRGSVYEHFDWERSKLLEILAAEDQQERLAQIQIS